MHTLTDVLLKNNSKKHLVCSDGQLYQATAELANGTLNGTGHKPQKTESKKVGLGNDTDSACVLCGQNSEEHEYVKGLTELNISNNKLIQGMVRLNDSDEETFDIDLVGANKIIEALEDKSCSLIVLDLSRNNLGAPVPSNGEPKGILDFADAIRINKSVQRLNLADNNLASRRVGEALGEMLKDNDTLLELNVSRNQYENELKTADLPCDMVHFAQKLSVGLNANTSLRKLIFGGNKGPSSQLGGNKRSRPELVCLELGMPEINCENKSLGVAAAILIAVWLPKCTTKKKILNLSQNRMGKNDESVSLLADSIRDGSVVSLHFAANGLKSLDAALKLANALKISAQRCVRVHF